MVICRLLPAPTAKGNFIKGDSCVPILFLISVKSVKNLLLQVQQTQDAKEERIDCRSAQTCQTTTNAAPVPASGAVRSTGHVAATGTLIQLRLREGGVLPGDMVNRGVIPMLCLTEEYRRRPS